MADDIDTNIPADNAVNKPDVNNDADRTEFADNEGIATRPNPDVFAEAVDSVENYPTLEEAEKEIADLLDNPKRPRDIASKFIKNNELNFTNLKSYISGNAKNSTKITRLPAWFARSVDTASLLRINDFQRTVHTRYMRKNLSLAYQRTYMMRDMKKSLRDIGDILTRKEDAIKVNTGLTAKSTITDDVSIDETTASRIKKAVVEHGTKLIGTLLTGKSLESVIKGVKKSAADKLSILDMVKDADNKIGRMANRISNIPNKLFDKVSKYSKWFGKESAAQAGIDQAKDVFKEFAPQWLKDKFKFTGKTKSSGTIADIFDKKSAYRKFMKGWKKEQLSLLTSIRDNLQDITIGGGTPPGGGSGGDRVKRYAPNEDILDLAGYEVKKKDTKDTTAKQDETAEVKDKYTDIIETLKNPTVPDKFQKNYFEIIKQQIVGNANANTDSANDNISGIMPPITDGITAVTQQNKPANDDGVTDPSTIDQSANTTSKSIKDRLVNAKDKTKDKLGDLLSNINTTLSNLDKDSVAGKTKDKLSGLLSNINITLSNLDKDTVTDTTKDKLGNILSNINITLSNLDKDTVTDTTKDKLSGLLSDINATLSNLDKNTVTDTTKDKLSGLLSNINTTLSNLDKDTVTDKIKDSELLKTLNALKDNVTKSSSDNETKSHTVRSLTRYTPSDRVTANDNDLESDPDVDKRHSSDVDKYYSSDTVKRYSSDENTLELTNKVNRPPNSPDAVKHYSPDENTLELTNKVNRPPNSSDEDKRHSSDIDKRHSPDAVKHYSPDENTLELNNKVNRPSKSSDEDTLDLTNKVNRPSTIEAIPKSRALSTEPVLTHPHKPSFTRSAVKEGASKAKAGIVSAATAALLGDKLSSHSSSTQHPKDMVIDAVANSVTTSDRKRSRFSKFAAAASAAAAMGASAVKGRFSRDKPQGYGSTEKTTDDKREAYSFFGERKRRREAAGIKESEIGDPSQEGEGIPKTHGAIYNFLNDYGFEIGEAAGTVGLAALSKSRIGRLVSVLGKRKFRQLFSGKAAATGMQAGADALGGLKGFAGKKAASIGEGLAKAFSGLASATSGKERAKIIALGLGRLGVKGAIAANTAPLKVGMLGAKGLWNGSKLALTGKIGGHTLAGWGLKGLWEGTKLGGRVGWAGAKIAGGGAYQLGKSTLLAAPKAAWTVGKNLATSPITTISKGLRGGGLKGALKGGIGSIVAGMVLDKGEELLDKHTQQGSAVNILGHTGARAANWAMTGAMLGSILPGVGNVAGAIIGGLAGTGYELAHHLNEINAGFKSFSDSTWGAKPKYDDKGNLIPEPTSTMGTILAALSSTSYALAPIGKLGPQTGDNNNSNNPPAEVERDRYGNPVNKAPTTQDAPTTITQPTTSVASTVPAASTPIATPMAPVGGSVAQIAPVSDPNPAPAKGNITATSAYKDTFKALPKDLQDKINKSPNGALKYTVWSTGVQYGAKKASGIINDAYKARPTANDNDLITNIFQKRATSMSSEPMVNNAEASLANAKQEKLAHEISSGKSSGDYQTELSSTGGRGGQSLQVATGLTPGKGKKGGGKGVTRCQINNNPGNIDFHDQKYATRENHDGHHRFAHFASLRDGIAMMRNQLELYNTRDGLQTIRQMISKWSPKEDGNNPDWYAGQVAQRLNTSPDTPLGIINNTQATEIMKGIAGVESGPPGKLFWPDIDRVMASANGSPWIPLTGNENLISIQPDYGLKMRSLRKNKNIKGRAALTAAAISGAPIAGPPVAGSPPGEGSTAGQAPSGGGGGGGSTAVTPTSTGSVTSSTGDGTSSAPVSDGRIHNFQDYMNAGIGSLTVSAVPNTVTPPTVTAPASSGDTAAKPVTPREVSSPAKPADNKPATPTPTAAKPKPVAATKTVERDRYGNPVTKTTVSDVHRQQTAKNTGDSVGWLEKIHDLLTKQTIPPTHVTQVNTGPTTIAPSPTDSLSLSNGHDVRSRIG